MPKAYSYLIKPASATCNLKCTYCFYNDVADHRTQFSYGNMSLETTNLLIEKTLDVENGSDITYAFQGGEPTLVGVAFFHQFITKVNQTKKDQQSIHYAIQTNGTLLNSEWMNLFKANNFLVGISLDGFELNHNKYRISKEGHTFFKVMDGIELLRKYKVDFNVLTVLTEGLAQSPKELFEFYLKEKMDYIQLIPCLPDFDLIENKDALTPQSFASFYKVFYDLWLEETQKNHLMSIGLFDNIIPMFVGVKPQMCGMLGYCSPQMVIESNGDVYPCDFYVLDQYKMGNITQDTLNDLWKNTILHDFLKEEKRMSSACEICKFKALCHGNCKRMNIVYFDEAGYCGYQDFLEHSHKSMMEIASQLR